MIELILLRHGKSDWGAGGADDERPLSKRGETAARLIGRLLAGSGRPPDLVLTSPARRASATARLAAEAGGWPAPLVEDDRLLPGSPSAIMAAVGQRAAGVGRVMVVGHEPALSATAARLLGGAAVRMATGAAACIEVDGLPPTGPGVLLWMVIPRLLADGLRAT